MKKVAVIGAGLSGLSTAYYLRKLNPAADVVIFEASPRAGGIIETVRSSQVVMECGPDNFFNEKPWALELCRELGLEFRLMPTQAQFRRSFILNHGKLLPVPAGFYLTAPRSIQAWWNLPGMSFWGKLRMLGDLFLSPKNDNEDESVADFVTRRFGRETLEKLAQPMIAGVYTSRPDRLSLLSTFPQFREMEKKHGSVIRALMAQKGIQSASGARYGLFSSLQGGMSTLIETLQEQTGAHLRLSSPVKKIIKDQNSWVVKTEKGDEVFDAVCMTIASCAAAELLSRDLDFLAQQLKTIPFEPVAIINFIIDKKKIDHPLDGFGFVVPAEEKSSLIGCSFLHRKFEGRALNSELAILRAFVGGSLGHRLLERPESEITETVYQELKKILGIHDKPLDICFRRYDCAMPQYQVGHAGRIQKIEEELARHAGLFVAGYSYRGIGIPDCVKSAKSTAEKMTNYLTASANQY